MIINLRPDRKNLTTNNENLIDESSNQILSDEATSVSVRCVILCEFPARKVTKIGYANEKAGCGMREVDATDTAETS